LSSGRNRPAHDNQIRGFILEKGMKGCRRRRSAASSPARSIHGEIVWTGVVVPDALLPNVSGLKGTVRLPSPRPLRHLLGRMGRRRGFACTARANTYASTASSSAGHWRTQLGRRSSPTLETEIALRASGLAPCSPPDGRGKMAPEMISIVKRNNCGKALDNRRVSRDMHGGNGIRSNIT